MSAAETEASPRTVLHSYWRSSCSWRVRLALRLKKIDYEYRAVHLVKGEQSTSEHLLLNASAQVPVLEIDGLCLTESVSICEYLEETRSGDNIPSLLPKEPSKRALVRQIVEIVNSGIQPKQNLSLINYVSEHFGGEERKYEWARHWTGKGLDVLESTLRECAGSCCVGDEISLADCFVIPQVYNAVRMGLDYKKWETIAGIYESLSERQEFKDAHPAAQPDANT